MSRTSWNVYTQVSGSTYSADGTIYRPNNNVEITKTSTQQKIQLANGDNAFVNPETKSLKNAITFEWLELSDSDFNNLRAKIIAYMDAGTKIKITDHNSVDYIGRFINCTQVWISGVDDTEDLSATFEQTE